MFKLIRIALFALPLAGGAVLAHASGTSNSAGAAGSVTPPATGDTRTPTQEKAGRIDDTMPALPGDATKPIEPPNTAEPSNRNGMPDTTGMTTPGSEATDKQVHRPKGATDQSATPPVDESALPKKSDTTHDSTATDHKLDRDTTRDQLDSDK